MAEPSATMPMPPHEGRASVTDWIAVAAGALGALMATLDISITNPRCRRSRVKSARPAPKARGSRPAT